jgi:glycosyltransferase involved in cell wall biosynthesis
MGVPVVQTFHGLHYGYRNRLVQFLYISLEKLLANFTKLFINVSAGQQREGLELKIFPRSKSRLVVNGIDTRAVDGVKTDKTAFRRKLGLGPNDFVATMAARFDPVKGHERLIEILPDLLKNIPNLKIVFAGGGEERSRIQKLVREKGVYNAVRLLGERSDVLKIFKASDAAILPSYHEGMPLTVLESMACRLPVVGSDVVGIKDLVKDGENGYLVDFDNREEVAKALRQLGKSKELRQRMGERGRQFVEEKFPMEKFVKNTLAVYQESLK